MQVEFKAIRKSQDSTNTFSKAFEMEAITENDVDNISGVGAILSNAVIFTEELGYAPNLIAIVLESLSKNMNEALEERAEEEATEDEPEKKKSKKEKKQIKKHLEDENSLKNFIDQFHENPDFQKKVFKAFLKDMMD